MKSIYKGLLLFAMIIILTIVGNSAFGFLGGVLGFLAGLLIIVLSNKPLVLFMIGQREYTKGNHEKAYKWMKKAYATTKLSPQNSLSYAYLMIRDGMLTDSEALINKVTYLNRRDITNGDLLLANINKALILWKKDELSEAIKLLEEMYDKNLRSTTLYGTLGYFYILSNELGKAIEFNKEGYEYNSDNMIIIDNLGACYILNSEFEKAEEIYQKLFKMNPEFIEPYYNYGTLLEKKGMFDEAKEYYKKALSFPEKYLSTVKHSDIRSAIENLGAGKAVKAEEAPIENVQSDETHESEENA